MSLHALLHAHPPYGERPQVGQGLAVMLAIVAGLRCWNVVSYSALLYGCCFRS